MIRNKLGSFFTAIEILFMHELILSSKRQRHLNSAPKYSISLTVLIKKRKKKKKRKTYKGD